jgi:DNA-binding transcriptional regulator YiaG
LTDHKLSIFSDTTKPTGPRRHERRLVLGCDGPCNVNIAIVVAYYEDDPATLDAMVRAAQATHGIAVIRWTGVEIRNLRLALRLSVRAFAAQLGVSDRMVSKWEAAGNKTRPRPFDQEALDTLLARAPAEARARFYSIVPLPRPD